MPRYPGEHREGLRSVRWTLWGGLMSLLGGQVIEGGYVWKQATGAQTVAVCKNVTPAVGPDPHLVS